MKLYYKANKKEGNRVKIASLINKIGIKVKEIKNRGFGRAKVYYNDILQANRLIQEGEKCEKANFYIPRKVKKIKGIISDWDINTIFPAGISRCNR